MGLSYHYATLAPGAQSASQLATFLTGIESIAQTLGFSPTIVVNAVFETVEQLTFAKRVARGILIEDERLKTVSLDPLRYWMHQSSSNWCRVAPTHGVLLIVTDERGAETVFGFCRYPDHVEDTEGRIILRVPGSENWNHSAFVDSPDPRYRQLVSLFKESGYLASEWDEFASH